MTIWVGFVQRCAMTRIIVKFRLSARGSFPRGAAILFAVPQKKYVTRVYYLSGSGVEALQLSAFEILLSRMRHIKKWFFYVEEF